ncbi:porin [Spiribacter sp. 221]|uniref:porin n=1 Tax=Spiribacter onubensis TaxID=3122420 RepID=UPI00349F1C09
MMKKTTSALAAAALLGTGIGTASAATFQIDDSTSVDLGARFYSWVTGTKDAEGKSQTNYATSPRINVGASSDAVNGLTVSTFMQFRPQATLGNTKDDENDDGVRTHVAYGTVAGDFGSVTYGKNDNLFYRYLDILADKNDVLTYTFSNAIQRTRVLTYASPDFDGFGFEVEAALQGDNEKDALTDSASDNPGTRTSSKTSSINAAAYANLDPVTVHVAYAEGNLQNSNSDGAYGVGAVTTIQDVKVDAFYKYSNIYKDGVQGTKKQKIYGVIGEFDNSFGLVQLGAQQVKGNDISSRTEVIARGVYDLADNVYVSAEYRKADKSQDEGDGYALAFSYKF